MNQILMVSAILLFCSTFVFLLMLVSVKKELRELGDQFKRLATDFKEHVKGKGQIATLLAVSAKICP